MTDLKPLISFTINVSDKDAEAIRAMVNGVVSNPLWQEPFAKWSNIVSVRTVADAAMVRMAVSDLIMEERWSLQDDDLNSLYGYFHRVDGPAVRRGRFEQFWLFDYHLDQEDHAKAVAAGVADDDEKFTAWFNANVAPKPRAIR